MMAAALALVVSACSKEDNDICGEWHLSDISVVTKAQEPYDISVYLAFSKTGTFDLYQKLQELDPEGRRICELIMEGKSERDIASALGVSRNTYTYRRDKLLRILREQLGMYI